MAIIILNSTAMSFMYYTSLTNVTYSHTNELTNELHSLLSTHDVVFISLNYEDKIRYLLTLENETTSKIVGKYTYLMFQKRKDVLNSKYN